MLLFKYGIVTQKNTTFRHTQPYLETRMSSNTPLLTTPTPTTGAYMPAEWTPHAATWTNWPHNNDLWEGELNAVQEDFAGLISVISRYERVNLNVPDNNVQQTATHYLQQANATMSNIHFNTMPYNDVWLRDSGPIFIKQPNNKLAVIDWQFNGWGNKYEHALDNNAPETLAKHLNIKRYQAPYIMEGGALEINTQGVCLTTRSCLLNQNRNENLSEEELESILRTYLGVKHVIWLEAGLEGDHTDGHIDTIVRFTDDNTIVCSVTNDKNDTNYPVMQDNKQSLKSLRNHEGNPYTIIDLPLPKNRLEFHGERLAPTYANFYVGNGFVVVPQYNDPNDQLALDVLTPLFPGRNVIGASARHLITGGGAFHCVTQQQPQGDLDHEQP